MLIEEITENNFKEKIEEGDKRVNIKLRRFEKQIEELLEIGYQLYKKKG